MDIDARTQSEQVLIFDTTLPEGEQSPGCSMKTDEKVALAHQLSRLGEDIIAVGAILYLVDVSAASGAPTISAQ